MSTETKSHSTPGSARSPITGFVVVSCGYQNTDSLERFFAQSVVNTGISYFVCADLPLRHSIRIYELLKQVSQMPVYPVDSTMALEANSIYLCPSFSEVSLSGDQLTVEASRSNLRNRETLGLLLMALSQKGEQAALVSIADAPLTESRSLNQFRRCGGLVLEEVQEDREDIEDKVPEIADREIGVDGMHAVLRDHFGIPETPITEEDRRDQAELYQLCECLAAEVKVDFSQYRSEVLKRRVYNRMRRKEIADLSKYVSLASADASERQAVYEDFIVGGIRFFRDSEVIESYRTRIIPSLFDRHKDGSEIRIWVAGVASGEEAFSLAMLMDEYASENGIEDANFKIFATDVHEISLRKGIQAFYSLSSLKELSPERIERFFTRSSRGYIVASDLRRKVVFARHDILKDPPFSRLDFVACRNLLTYLKPAAQKKAIGMILFSLRLEGYFCLGLTETPNSYHGQIDCFDDLARIFCKKSDTYVSPTLLSPPRADGYTSTSLNLAAKTYSADKPQLSVVNSIMERFMPSSIVVDEIGEIVHTFGNCDDFMRSLSGRISLHYEDRLRPELKLSVHQSRARALKLHAKVACRCMIYRDEKRSEIVEITVEPLKGLRYFENCVLIIFGGEKEGARSVETPVAEIMPDEFSTPANTNESEASLRSELTLVKVRLNETVMQLETSNNELSMANEELLTSNEELQTTNEELHSVNEELFSVNAEYESKNRDLISLNEDINNLLSSTEIGTVFVERNLRIRKFTPAAHAILNLLPTDIGRPIDHISHNLIGYDTLVDDAKWVMDEGKGMEKEARMEGGILLLVRILPFKTGKQEVTGAVIALIDITELKQAEIQFVDSQRRLQLALEAADFGVWSFELNTGIFECDGRVERFFGFAHSGKEKRMAFLESIDFTIERFLSRESQNKDSSEGTIQESWSFAAADGVFRYLSTRAIIYRGVSGSVERISGVLWDETETKRSEQQILQKKNDLETLLYVVSHDLREPLRAIQSFSALLDERYRDRLEGKGIDFLNRIEAAANRMTALLDDVLNLSRINKMHAPMDRVFCSDLMEAVLKELEVRIHETDANIVMSSDLPELRANYTYAKQAVSNLVGNALKFVKPGEKPDIEITPYVSPSGAHVGLEIRDRGPGIPEESLDRVFKLFQRAVGRDIEGTGAGLAIVKQIAQKHGGDAWYEPRSGGGSKFTITFAK